MKEEYKDLDFLDILSRSLRFTRRYFIILIVFLICGSGWGIYKSTRQTNYHEKHLIMAAAHNHGIIIDLLRSLQLYVNQGNSEALAAKLILPTDAAASIIEIQADTIALTGRMGLRAGIKISNPAYTDTIGNALLGYLNSNKFLGSYHEKYSEVLKKEIADLNYLIGVNRLNNAAETDWATLLKRKAACETALARVNAVELIESHASVIDCTKPWYRVSIMYGLIFLFAGIFVSLLAEASRLIKKRNQMSS